MTQQPDLFSFGLEDTPKRKWEHPDFPKGSLVVAPIWNYHRNVMIYPIWQVRAAFEDLLYLKRVDTGYVAWRHASKCVAAKDKPPVAVRYKQMLPNIKRRRDVIQ